MRNNNLLALIFCLVSLVGCKDENSDSKGTANEEQLTSKFKVTLKFIAEKKDDFCLLYTEDGTTNFGDKAIWKGIEGSKDEQTVDFEFPEEVFPTQLRLDLGIKPDQSDIILKSITLDYDGKKREIIGAEMATFFRADESVCTFDAKTGIIKVNVENGTRKNASIYPQQPTLQQEIEKLAK